MDHTARGDLWKLRRPDHVDSGTGQLVKAEWVYTRDAAGRLTAERDPLGNTWTRVYDDAGRLIRITGPAGSERRFTYDARFRPTSIVIRRDGVNDPTRTIGYDAAGRIHTVTSAMGGVTTYAFDTQGRIASVTDPLNRVMGYGRDGNGRIVAITYPGGRQVTLQRDLGGRVTQRTMPGGRVETFTYDVNGAMLSAQAIEESWTGRNEWSYDLLGRPTRVFTSSLYGGSGATSEITFAYDANGNRVTMLDPGGQGTFTYAYDTLDRLTGVTSDYGNWTVSYASPSGHRTDVAVTGPNAASEHWAHDLAGRVVGHSWTGGSGTATGNTIWTLDAEGRVVNSVDNGTGATRHVTFGGDGLPALYESASGSEVTTQSLTFDLDGRLVQTEEADGIAPAVVTTFAWDAAGRLSNAQRGNTARTYVYEDQPEDPSVGLRVWRSPNDTSEDALQVDYDYDRRLRQAVASRQQRMTVTGLSNRWAPGGGARLLEATALLAAATYETRTLSLDLGGYHAERAGTLLRLPSAVGTLDASRAASRAGSVENGPSLPGAVTSLATGRDAIAASLGYEARSRVGITAMAAMSPTAADLFDDWLEAPLLSEAGEGAGDGWRPSSTPSTVTGIQTNGHFGPGGVWDDDAPPNFGDPSGCPHYHPEIAPGPFQCPGAQNPGFCAGGCTPPPSDPAPDWSNLEFGRQAPGRYEDISTGGVDLHTGDYIRTETDVSVYDPEGDIAFTRTYRSARRSDTSTFGALGHRWFHPWEEHLEFQYPSTPEQGNVRWIPAGGRSMKFEPPSDGGALYHAPNGVQVRLRRNADHTWDLRTLGGAVRKFGATGRR